MKNENKILLTDFTLVFFKMVPRNIRGRHFGNAAHKLARVNKPVRKDG